MNLDIILLQYDFRISLWENQEETYPSDLTTLIYPLTHTVMMTEEEGGSLH